MADTGTAEGGVVALHGGFIPGGPILTAFPNADFTANGYQVALYQRGPLVYAVTSDLPQRDLLNLIGESL